MSKPLPPRLRGLRRLIRSLPEGIAILCICFIVQPALAADPAADVMVIFDGSGSMWGKPPGERQPKLALAREALRQSLPRLSRQARVGLMAFGHRRGDCTDIEVVAPPAAIDPVRLLGPLERLNPKGKGPLALAVGEAARVLGAATTPGSVVLIHDDVDNCAPDPCTAIAEITRIYPRLTIHVVSIGLLPEDVQRMACFVRTPGGKVHDVQSSADLLTAVGEALATGSAPPAKPVPRPQLASRDASPGGSVPAPAAKPGLYLAAALAASTDLLDVPVHWRVTSIADASRLAVYQEEAVTPRLTLPAGRYEIEARLSQITARQTVDVDPAAAQRVTLVLSAGTIRVTPTSQRGNTPVRGALVTISRPESGAGGAATGRPGEPVVVSNAAQSEIALAPGPYVIGVTHGLFRTDRQVMVVAGTRGQLAIQLPTGEVELQAVAAPGAPPLTNAVFQVFEDDPDAPQGRRELVRSASARASFSLPAGTYYVVARHGVAEARERITVRPGEVERRTLTISLAQLALAATIAGVRPDSGDSIVYRIERIDGAQQGEVARLTRPRDTLDLAPGRYRIESRIGSHNARAERTIELGPGAREEVTMDHRAGVVRLVLVEPGSTHPATDVFWEVKDQSGRTVWITSEPQPLGILQAGRYAVRAEHRARRADGEINVQAGDNRVMELIAK